MRGLPGGGGFASQVGDPVLDGGDLGDAALQLANLAGTQLTLGSFGAQHPELIGDPGLGVENLVALGGQLRAAVIEPELMSGGISGYVEGLYQYFE